MENNGKEAGKKNRSRDGGDGVAQGTPEESVGHFCDAARASVYAKETVGA